MSGYKLDVLILDVQTERRIAQVTYDGVSRAPVWSQAGDELVDMRVGVL